MGERRQWGLFLSGMEWNGKERDELMDTGLHCGASKGHHQCLAVLLPRGAS